MHIGGFSGQDIRCPLTEALATVEYIAEQKEGL